MPSRRRRVGIDARSLGLITPARFGDSRCRLPAIVAQPWWLGPPTRIPGVSPPGIHPVSLGGGTDMRTILRLDVTRSRPPAANPKQSAAHGHCERTSRHRPGCRELAGSRDPRFRATSRSPTGAAERLS